jgi:gamma-glutamyl-gamma-aminobutyrate hydrolase PuuD
MKVLIVGGGKSYAKMFASLGMELTDSVEEADLMCFTGGEDVSPNLYGEDVHPSTYSNSTRDGYESAMYYVADYLEIPMVGICRGAQFLHVMNGGKLYQDVDGHATGAPHKALDRITGEEHIVTSTHHQMMRYVAKGEIVASASESFQKHWMDGSVTKTTLAVVNQDVEVMWYKDTKCLCFQPHPEFSYAIEGAESTYLYFKNLLERYYGDS